MAHTGKDRYFRCSKGSFPFLQGAPSLDPKSRSSRADVSGILVGDTMVPNIE